MGEVHVCSKSGSGHFLGSPTAHTHLTHALSTHALGQNQICKPVLCPKIVYIMEGHGCFGVAIDELTAQIKYQTCYEAPIAFKYPIR